MLLKVSETAEELHPWATYTKVSQRAKNSDFKGLTNALNEGSLLSLCINRLKLGKSLLNDIIGGRTKVIPRDVVLEPPGYLTTLHEGRPDIRQDVRVDTLIERTTI